MCTFLDQFSRYLTIATIARKSHTSDIDEEYSNSHITKWFKKGITKLHTDGGGEYETINMCLYCHSTTAPYTPEQKAFAERVNRTIWDPVRIILQVDHL